MSLSFWDMLYIDARTARPRTRFVAPTVDDTRLRLQAAERAIKQQERELETLRALVAVLATTLRDANVLDTQVLDARLEAALDDAELRDEEGAVDDQKVACLSCKQRVLPSECTVTATGYLCTRCGG
jgi:hypothetical protein